MSTSTPPDDILDLLTAYALGALEPEEVAHVSDLLEKDPALRELLADLRLTADQISLGLPGAEPPPELRQKALDRAFGRSPRVNVPLAIQQAPNRLRGWLAALATATAVALVVAAIGWLQLAGVRGELAQTQAMLAQQQAASAQLSEVLAKNPSTVALSGAAGQATVLRNSEANQIVLAANLPPLGTDQVYQFWLIDSGTPVSAGTFTVDQQGYGLLALQQSSLPASAGYAITAEPGPNGSTKPTTPILLSNSPPA